MSTPREDPMRFLWKWKKLAIRSLMSMLDEFLRSTYPAKIPPRWAINHSGEFCAITATEWCRPRPRCTRARPTALQREFHRKTRLYAITHVFWLNNPRVRPGKKLCVRISLYKTTNWNLFNVTWTFSRSCSYVISFHWAELTPLYFNATTWNNEGQTV